MSHVGSPGPATLSPRIAALLVGSHLALIALLWSFPDEWARAASALDVSSTTFAATSTIALAVSMLTATRSITVADLGFTRRKIAEALVVGLAVWLACQAVAAALARIFRSTTSAPAGAVDSFAEALLVGYGEELVFRLVAIGGIWAATIGRTSSRRAVWIAGTGAVALFVLSHVPHDVVRPEGNMLERYAGLVAYGTLITAVYFRTANLALIAILHALLNQPLLVVDPGGARPAVWLTIYMACVAILWWRRPRASGTQPRQRRV